MNENYCFVNFEFLKLSCDFGEGNNYQKIVCNLVCLKFQEVNEFVLVSLFAVGRLLWIDRRVVTCHWSKSQLASKNVAQLEDRHGCKFGHLGHRCCFAYELVSEIVYSCLTKLVF